MRTTSPRSNAFRMPEIGESEGVLIAVRVLGNTEGYKIRIPDRSLIRYAWGMHICDYDEEKKGNSTCFMTGYACGIPRN